MTVTAKPQESAGDVSASASQRSAAAQLVYNRITEKPSKKAAKTIAGTQRTKIKRPRPVILAKIHVHAEGADVPIDTALAVVLQESSFRANVTGAAGEIGLMQLKCQTARGIGYKGTCDDLYDPDTNLHYGLRYLRKALNRGSVAYYNAGIYAKKLPEAAKDYADSVEVKRSNSDKYRRDRFRPSAPGFGYTGPSGPVLL
ncbi:MAG: lytic transglycosylase domain-containing protein [Pseudomonadota bacterium]